MKKMLILFAVSMISITILFAQTNTGDTMDQSIYDFEVITIDGKETTLADYKGKTMLIVNVASKCGFTKQYEGLQNLYEKYKNKDFVILGFPSNQFGKQEPGTNEEIKEFCSTTYGVSFPMFDKINVNGDEAHPLYVFLKEKAPGSLGTKSIKWNFTKFLVDKEGNVLERYGSAKTPEELNPIIDNILNK